jgi:Xaa-Pro aminopeptidase
VFAERRRRFLESLGEGSIALLLGARLQVRSEDTHYRFRQDSDFHYLTGFDHPNAAALLRADGGPPFTLFVEPRERQAETWNGYRPGVEGAVEDYGADEAHPAQELPEELAKLLDGITTLHHMLGRDLDLDRKIAETLDGLRRRSRQGHGGPARLVDPREILHEMRLHKEPAELAILRRAAAISTEAHEHAARLAQDGVFEYELEAALDYVFRRRGASGPAYTSIVGGGRNATILHYISNDQKLRGGDLVLVDAGCELDGYASDVTRTYPVGGRFEGAHRAVYDVVLEAQRRALEAIRPGATLDAIHDLSVRCLCEGMVEIGLLAGQLDEIVSKGAYQPYYMHRTSHWLGLDVHDVGTYRSGGKPRPLEPGMVFTVEPGLYVASDDEQADERWRGIGVRIEDDVVVTENGCEILTEAIPKQPEDVEAWVLASSTTPAS